MRTFQIPELAADLKRRASSRQISPDNRYLSSYPDLLEGMKTMRPLDRRNVILISHCGFGWMPTQLTINTDLIDAAVQILRDAETLSEHANAEQIRILTQTSQTVKGTSVVAAAKIHHFIAPSSYPMRDKHVVKLLGASANGKRAADECVKFTWALRQAIDRPDGKDACMLCADFCRLRGLEPNSPICAQRNCSSSKARDETRAMTFRIEEKLIGAEEESAEALHRAAIPSPAPH